MDIAGHGSLDPNVLPLDAFNLTGVESDTQRLISLKDSWYFDGERVSYPQTGYVAGRGYWQKHADGTLVQWGQSQTESWPYGVSGHTVTFPINFYDTNVYIPAPGIRPATYWPTEMGAGIAAVTNNAYFGYVINNASSAQNGCVYWIAFGRWKA